MTEIATTDPGTETQTPPVTPPATDPATTPADPARQPQTVPVSVLVDERRKYGGRIQSLQARIQELEGKQTQTPPANTSEEEQHIQQVLKRYGLDKDREELKELKAQLKIANEKAALGERAHATMQRNAERAMVKAEGFVSASFDKDLESVGFTKETWEAFVTSQVTEEDIAETFSDPSHIKSVIKKCRDIYAPKIDKHKATVATTVRNLVRPPGPGGTPPAPAQPEAVKGKALHSRAYERLSDRVRQGER